MYKKIIVIMITGRACSNCVSKQREQPTQWNEVRCYNSYCIQIHVSLTFMYSNTCYVKHYAFKYITKAGYCIEIPYVFMKIHKSAVTLYYNTIPVYYLPDKLSTLSAPVLEGDCWGCYSEHAIQTVCSD